MKIRSMDTLESKSVPAPRMITLFEPVVDRDEPRRDGASAQTHFWVRTSNYAWATGVVAVGLGLHVYYVREMLASLVLFSLLFFCLTLAVLSLFFICYAGQQAATWTGRASRAVMAFFMQQDVGGIELVRVPVVEEGRHLPDQRSEV